MLIGVLDDETNLEELEANVRAIEKDGLVWGASKWVPLAYAIQKLQINLVVEDEKVSTDELQQQIEEDEDHVQSTDVVSFRELPSNTDYHADSLPPGCYAEAVIAMMPFMKNGVMMDIFLMNFLYL